MPRFAAAFAVLLVFASACASDDIERAGTSNSAVVVISEIPDPAERGAVLPSDYREALPRDAIRPIYDPSFVSSAGVDWPDDELVIGVDLNGEQRAYPVGFLTFREIVIDDHRGIPTMVTW